jgi:LacI family transcriptional regulator
MHAKKWTTAFGYESMIQLIKQNQTPDAVIALNDEIASGIYNACKEFQIEIGKDISIVSFDDSEIAAILMPGLTTGRLPYTEIGELAIEKLVNKDSTPGLILLDMPVKVRESVAY